MMMATIRIAGLVIFAYHGVDEAEERLGQRFILDLELEVDIAEAVRTDRVGSTVDYAEVTSVIEAEFRSRRFHLIEAAAAYLAEVILARFATVHTARVTVRKPSAPVPAAIDHVSVTVERKRHG
jgi:dihydroneopterin aldolase